VAGGGGSGGGGSGGSVASGSVAGGSGGSGGSVPSADFLAARHALVQDIADGLGSIAGGVRVLTRQLDAVLERSAPTEAIGEAWAGLITEVAEPVPVRGGMATTTR
jgi:hypothetical protein